jgi:hypothetical protein
LAWTWIGWLADRTTSLYTPFARTLHSDVTAQSPPRVYTKMRNCARVSHALAHYARTATRLARHSLAIFTLASSAHYPSIIQASMHNHPLAFLHQSDMHVIKRENARAFPAPSRITRAQPRASRTTASSFSCHHSHHLCLELIPHDPYQNHSCSFACLSLLLHLRHFARAFPALRAYQTPHSRARASPAFLTLSSPYSLSYTNASCSHTTLTSLEFFTTCAMTGDSHNLKSLGVVETRVSLSMHH